MISADDALKLVLSSVTAVGVERLTIRQAVGRVLAEPICSLRDIPAFDNSAMDGFAVRAEDTFGATQSNPVRLKIIETIGAGHVPQQRVSRGLAAKIMTGAPLPEGADAVIPVEQTKSTDDTVEVFAPVTAGYCVRRRGEDLRAGEQVLTFGRRLRAADIGLLASLGRAVIDVYRRPRVAIVCTGDELVDVDQQPVGAQIVNSNAYSLAAAIEESGAEAFVLPVARDDKAEMRARFKEALQNDALVTTGGVSVGQFDHVKEVLSELGMQELFHGVAQRPGKPLMFGLVEGRPVFGLPGNPVSTLVCFELYVRPALKKMAGLVNSAIPRAKAVCAVDIKTARGLTEFIRVKLERRAETLYASPSGEQGSAILSTMSRADALLVGPADKTLLPAGSYADVLLLASDAIVDWASSFET